MEATKIEFKYSSKSRVIGREKEWRSDNEDEKTPYSGEDAFEDGTFRFYKGYLHGPGDIPSQEYLDGHVEHRKHGVLHRLGYPAVYDRQGTYGEWWENGVMKAFLLNGKKIVVENGGKSGRKG